jgi:pyruvate formate lyase activating enzyme
MFEAGKCIGCGNCYNVCRQHAIIKTGEEGFAFNRSLCNNCGKCIQACYTESRIMKGSYMSEEAIMAEIVRDTSFYENSGGGITFSGGEPLMQASFLCSLLAFCKKNAVSTVIETCGYANWADYAKIAPYTDIFLFDIKHMDSERHKRFTGKENRQILKNCRDLASMGKHIIIRIPVIPTFNMDEKSLGDIASFAVKLGVKEIDLLPYHRFGSNKYKLLMREYWDCGYDRAEKDIIRKMVDNIKTDELYIKIGG